MSRYNPSVCNQQPSRRSQLLWPASRHRNRDTESQYLQHEVQTAPTNGIPKRRSTSRKLDRDFQNAGIGEALTTNGEHHNSRHQSGVIGDPNALINRPKSAYTRNLRTTDEEPVFWQHSHRSTSRYHRSQITVGRSSMTPSVPSIGTQTESRRSNASNFESLLDRTFTAQPMLNLQPNPVITIEPPKSPLSPVASMEDPPISEEASVPNPADLEVSCTQVTPSQKRYSGFRPLQLSFYLPGNRLSLLPRFGDDHNLDYEIPPVPGIARPPSALLKAKVGSAMPRPPMPHSIPRKAVAPRSSIVEIKSNRPRSQNNVISAGEEARKESRISDIRSERAVSMNVLRQKHASQSAAHRPLPTRSRTTSQSLNANTQRFSTFGTRVQSLQFEPYSQEQQQRELEVLEILNESSSASPVSPISSVTESPFTNNKVETYHDYNFTEARQLPEQHATVDYHDYGFEVQAAEISDSSYRSPSPHVAPLFQSSTSATSFSDHGSLPSPLKPRSSSGSSTLYHGESSSESSLTLAKASTTKKLSIAFPSPTLQHRLSEWLSRSASQIQQPSSPPPQQGECFNRTDSPTLGFSWKDFGFSADKRTSSGRQQHLRTRAFTDASSSSTFVNGSGDEGDGERYPRLSRMVSVPVEVGVAF